MKFLAVLRHLKGFLEKCEESGPPLKLKNTTTTTFFYFSLECFFQECKTYQKTLFRIEYEKYESHLRAIYFYVNPFRTTVYQASDYSLEVRRIAIFILSASILLNFYTELLRVVVLCRSSNTAIKAVALFKKKFQIIPIHFNEYFPYFVEASFLLHARAQQNKLNMWQRKQAMQPIGVAQGTPRPLSLLHL